MLSLSASPCCRAWDAGKTLPHAPSLGIPFSSDRHHGRHGTEAATGKTVRVYYTGWLYSTTATDNKGGVFDSNRHRPWLQFHPRRRHRDQGMGAGRRRDESRREARLIIPPELGYGVNGSGQCDSRQRDLDLRDRTSGRRRVVRALSGVS